MKYIEIVAGVSIRVDAIEAIEQKDALTCVVRTQFNTYDSTFPYTTLLQLLEREEKSVPIKAKEEVVNVLKETEVSLP